MFGGISYESDVLSAAIKYGAVVNRNDLYYEGVKLGVDGQDS